MATNKPITIGANLKIKDLPDHIDWLIESQRDLELFDPSDGNVLDNDWKGLARQACALLDGYQGRLGIHGPWEGLPLLCRDLQVRKLVTLRLKQALEFASAVGATQMVLHSPFEFYGSPMVAHTPAFGLEEEISQVHQVLDPVIPMAQQINCEIAIEVSYDTHSGPLIKLVESFQSDYVRVSLDTGHAFLLQRLGGPPPDQWVRDAGLLLSHLHLEDTDGFLDRHWAPGEGNVNWFALFEALGELDHRPRLILEVKSSKIRQAFEWLSSRGFAG